MRGQTQAVTAVMLTTVIVGSVATAYVWGAPLLQKQRSEANLAEIESDALKLRNAIVKVSRSGKGVQEVLNLGGASDKQFELRINERTDYIQITTRSQSPPYPIDTWSLIKGDNFHNLTFGRGSYAIKGRDLLGVVGVKAVGGPGSTILLYRIEFRNMKEETPSGSKLYKIDIRTEGQSTASDQVKLKIMNEGTRIDAGGDRVKINSTGVLMRRERTLIKVDILG